MLKCHRQEQGVACTIMYPRTGRFHCSRTYSCPVTARFPAFFPVNQRSVCNAYNSSWHDTLCVAHATSAVGLACALVQAASALQGAPMQLVVYVNIACMRWFTLHQHCKTLKCRLLCMSTSQIASNIACPMFSLGFAGVPSIPMFRLTDSCTLCSIACKHFEPAALNDGSYELGAAGLGQHAMCACLVASCCRFAS